MSTIADAMPGKKHRESTFGEPLPNLRKDRGLTPVQLAETEARRQWKRIPVIATCPDAIRTPSFA